MKFEDVVAKILLVAIVVLILYLLGLGCYALTRGLL